MPCAQEEQGTQGQRRLAASKRCVERASATAELPSPCRSPLYADHASRTHGGTIHANQGGDGLSHGPLRPKPPHPEAVPKRVHTSPAVP
eukprot:5294829-Pleurochrysis_carterae.AAC.1